MAIIRLTNRYIKDGKIVGYRGIYLPDGNPISLSIADAWLIAKDKSIENVVAIGNITIPTPYPDGSYPFTKQDRDNMRLRGINGFKISNLPTIPDWC